MHCLCCPAHPPTVKDGLQLSCQAAQNTLRSRGLCDEIANRSGLRRRSDDKPQLGAQLRIGEACSFQSFKTNNYKLHFMETLSGLKVGFLGCRGSRRAEAACLPQLPGWWLAQHTVYCVTAASSRLQGQPESVSGAVMLGLFPQPAVPGQHDRHLPQHADTCRSMAASRLAP